MPISIITPVYNGAAHIRSTLDSLAQQPIKFEHIVMDSCSKDGTGDIVREYQGKYGVKLVVEKDEGHYDAVSKGFARASGDILGWINAGDFYMRWTLPVVEQVFAKYPEVQWITGMPGIFFENTQRLDLVPVAPVYIQSLIRGGYHNGKHLPAIQQESTFWRRSLWERAGGEALLRGQGKGKGFAQDFQLWKAFSQHAPLVTVRTLLSAFSICEGQITDKYRNEYYRECGLDKAPDKVQWWTTYPWMAYSFLRTRKTINVRNLP